jgi:hypothetical protein
MDTFLVVISAIFAIGMFILLPKYARFINNQPKQHLELMRQKAEEEKAKKNGEEKSQD